MTAKDNPPTPSKLFRSIYLERIKYHKTRNKIYLNDLNDIVKSVGKITSGSIFQPTPELKYKLPTAKEIPNIEFVFIHVFLAKLYLNTHYLAIQSYCNRHNYNYFIPPDFTEDSHKIGKIIYESLHQRAIKYPDKKFVIIGMSKGAIDAMDSIIYSADTISFARQHIKALVSIGGSVGGSPIADYLHDKLLKHFPQRGLLKSTFARGIHSMRTDIRVIRNKYFTQLCPEEIKLFSISFLNKKYEKSVLALSTKILRQLNTKNDGFLLLKHTKIPGSVDLGNYEGDHSKLLPFFNRHHVELFEAIIIYLKQSGVI